MTIRPSLCLAAQRLARQLPADLYPNNTLPGIMKAHSLTSFRRRLGRVSRRPSTPFGPRAPRSGREPRPDGARRPARRGETARPPGRDGLRSGQVSWCLTRVAYDVPVGFREHPRRRSPKGEAKRRGLPALVGRAYSRLKYA